MKSRLLIALLSLGLGLNTALLVVTVVKLERVERRVVEAASGEGKEEGRGGPSMLFGLPRVDPKELNLSPEQHEKIRRLRAQWKAEEAERRREFIERRQAIPELFESEEISMERLAPLLDQAHEDARARLAAVVRLYNQYQEILTPEQQQDFKRMIREQRERHRERWERFKERRERRRGDIDPRRLERFREERLRRMERREDAAPEEDLSPPMPGERPPLEPGPVPQTDPPPVETGAIPPPGAPE